MIITVNIFQSNQNICLIIIFPLTYRDINCYDFSFIFKEEINSMIEVQRRPQRNKNPEFAFPPSKRRRYAFIHCPQKGVQGQRVLLLRPWFLFTNKTLLEKGRYFGLWNFFISVPPVSSGEVCFSFIFVPTRSAVSNSLPLLTG